MLEQQTSALFITQSYEEEMIMRKTYEKGNGSPAGRVALALPDVYGAQRRQASRKVQRNTQAGSAAPEAGNQKGTISWAWLPVTGSRGGFRQGFQAPPKSQLMN